MKIKTYKNGYATWDVVMPSGMIEVRVRCNNGFTDRIRCDDRRMAREYWRAFCLIAKNA